MASAQVEIMGQVKQMADVISNITVENIFQLRNDGRLTISADQLELLATIVRNSVDQGYGNAASSLIRTIDRRSV
jgi:hypothetical protein